MKYVPVVPEKVICWVEVSHLLLICTVPWCMFKVLSEVTL